MNRKSNFESDPKYRSYSVAIDKCLKSFEYSNEWADLISSLVRLMKVDSSLSVLDLFNKYVHTVHCFINTYIAVYPPT